MVLNILCGRTPSYRVTEFYEDTATGVLFGQEIESEHFSDDCLARALDKLAESKPRAVYSRPSPPPGHRAEEFLDLEEITP